MKDHFTTFVFGGTRSGKSRYAQSLTELRCNSPVYLATAEIHDEEMADRVSRHKSDRGPQWGCVEEPVMVAEVLSNPPNECDGILLDCMTLWASNVMYSNESLDFAIVLASVLKAIEDCPVEVIVVSNEVGMGIVPDNALGREFRDVSGRMNQSLASVCDNVVLVAAGLPLVLKGLDLMLDVSGEKEMS